MSILIQQTRGGSVSNDLSNLAGPGGGGAGDMPLWLVLRPKAPLMIMQTAVARGDGTTTTFTATTDGYVTGFLEVFINGVKQRKTTHYTETTPADGTFTMVQAPKTNDYIDVIYGAVDYGDYCGLILCDVTAEPNPVAASWAAPGDSQRVFILFGDSGTNLYLAMCENARDASPTWSNVSTGLPTFATTSVEPGFFLDPFFPSTKGWVTVSGAAVSGSSDEVYYNSNITGGGSWSVVYNLATHNTTTGTSATLINIMCADGMEGDGLFTTAAESGRIGFGVIDNAGNRYYIHSHNSGSTWTSTTLTSANRTGTLVVVHSNRDSSKVWIAHKNTSTNRVMVAASTDGGHTFGAEVTASSVNANAGRLVIPYKNNTTDQTIYLVNNSGQLRRSTDAGANWADFSNTAFYRREIQFAVDDETKGYAFSSVLAKLASTDSGATWGSAVAPLSIGGYSIVKTDVQYVFGNTSSTYVMISFDWTNFTDITGNLTTAVATPSSSRCFAITADWSS